jgi:hypothetical protein
MSDHKLKTHKGRSKCQLSEKHSSYVEEVGDSMATLYPYLTQETLETIRVASIKGARTRCHTDSFGGLTENYVTFHGTGAGLVVHRFPSFRTSVVLLRGRPYIPMAYSERTGLKMYSLHASNAEKFLFPADAVDELQPFGNIPYVVAGIKKGKLQVVATNEGPKRYESCADFQQISVKEAYKLASLAKNLVTKNRKGKHSSYKIQGKMGKWSKFEAWRYRHEFYGDPFVCRTHVYFRLVRTPISGSNYVKSPKNFTEVSYEQLEKGLFNGNVIPPYMYHLNECV